MKIGKEVIIPLFLLAVLLAACSRADAALPASSTSVMGTAVSVAQTNMAATRAARPIVTPTATPTFPLITPSPLPSTPPTPISTYEADHEAIRQVIDAYFGRVYAMQHTFQVDGFGDTVSTTDEAKGFLKTELRKQALRVTLQRQNFLRYASYSYTLDYSEIVVFDAGQRARANFTEGNRVLYELSIPSGTESGMSGVHHITILKKEGDAWKIVYDVHDEIPRRSLYAPTPFPQDVLAELDKRLLQLDQGQGGPALPSDLASYIPSDPAQPDRWQEYETALAEKLMPGYPREKVLCEWELMGKSPQKLHLWALCLTTVTSAETGNYYFPAASLPALIHLDASGGIQSVEIPEYGESYVTDFWRLAPKTVWSWRPHVAAMEKHLHWRRTHPSEPPLVVLNAEAAQNAAPPPTPVPVATLAATPEIESGVWVGQGLKDETIYCLAIDPVTPSTLYAGVYGGGVFKSTDGGWTWSGANTGLSSVVIMALAVDPGTPSTIYAATGNRGVFKSMDGGGSWFVSNVGLKNSTVEALAIDPSAPVTLYAGTAGGGAFKSTDAGATWSAANAGLTDPYISALAIDPDNPSTLYAGTLDGVFKSTDGSRNWRPANMGMSRAHVVALAIDPVRPATLYAGTYSRGVFKSTDGGATWHAANNGLTATDILSLAIDPENPSALYAGSFQLGVFQSTDGGASWSRLRNGMPATVVNALVLDPNNPASLYAGTWYNGAYVMHLEK